MSDQAADAFTEQEAATARWQAAFRDPEFMEALLNGVPKRPEGWWQNLPACPVLAMFELFPLVRPH